MKKEKKLFAAQRSESYMPNNLNAFIKCLEKLRDKYVPNEYKENSTINIFYEPSDDHIVFQLNYTRPETDEEYAKRLDMEKLAKFQQEEREREQLRKLKEKFGE